MGLNSKIGKSRNTMITQREITPGSLANKIQFKKNIFCGNMDSDFKVIWLSKLRKIRWYSTLMCYIFKIPYQKH